MKIGQFANLNHTSIDTVRHYMSLGLIVPEKQNKQFEFDENCLDDFQEITTLKNIGFTLSEIQQLMLYRRIGKLTAYDRRITYTSFFEKKKKQIEFEINKLNSMNQNLDTALRDMKKQLEIDQSAYIEPFGIKLNALELLCCPQCHQPLNIAEGNIQNGQLINANLKCEQKHQVQVIDGILSVNNLLPTNDSDKSNADIHQYSENYIDEYINTTHIDYLQKLHEGLQWSSRHIDFEGLTSDVALELGSGHGYFMRHMIDRFPETFTYIAVDHDPIKLRWLKKIIERSQPKCTVIFICTDFTQIPLKPSSIDMLLDISGSSNYAFDYSDFLLEKIDFLVKEDAKIHGYYIIFKNFMSQSDIPLKFRDGFKIQTVKSNLKKLNYRCLEDYETEPVEKGGPLENYFVEGEHVSSYLYNGVKIKKPLG
ncbi:MerR family transcriptional regulator [Fusibacter bizertensis]